MVSIFIGLSFLEGLSCGVFFGTDVKKLKKKGIYKD